MKRKFTLFFLLPVFLLLIAHCSWAGRIHLKSGTIETTGTAQVMSLMSMRPGAGYYLVSLNGPVTEDVKTAIAGVGAEILEYIPDFAFLVRIENSRLRDIKDLPNVEWVGQFRADYKIESGVKQSEGNTQFVVSLFSGEERERIISKAKLLGAKPIDAGSREQGSIIRILADKTQAAALARSGAVAWIEPYRLPRLCNDVASSICAVPETRSILGIYGAGQIAAVADAGLDTGNADAISLDFAGRVVKTYSLRRPGDWSDLNGHGTHVVGSLLGSGVLSGSDPGGHVYVGSFAGYAPEASLVFQSIGDAGDFVFPPLHLAELFQPAYDDGARVHSNSWGSVADGQYTVYSADVDQFVWDHKDFTLLFAVGNEAEDQDENGIVDSDNLYAPSTAKNCISVGATESERSTGGYQMGYGDAWSSSYTAAPIKYDPISNNAFGIAAFSGRGPTDDERIKPDICAPGTNIVSCRCSLPGSPTGWGVYDDNYIYWGGTSMSTPQVAGAAVLVREYYQKEKQVNASAALVKATLINGARDVYPGQYGSGSVREVSRVPDKSQGWGRMDLKASLFPHPPAVCEFVDQPSCLITNEYREHQYAVINNSVPFKVTLVWTDYPGAVHAAKELVNDLDLYVVAPNGNVYGNVTGPDHTNNVEQVNIDLPMVGTYTVRVTGYNVPMGPQDYALAVSGGMPNTYIAGRVTSTSGAGVQGAIITLVSAEGVKRVPTDINGGYITRVSPGDYSVQAAKPGWMFQPRGQAVSVSSSPVENVDFQGQGAPGSAAGAIVSKTGGIVSYVVESPHPYLNNWSQVYEVAAHDDATRMRVHFAEIDLMNDGDVIYVLDGNENLISSYTGKGEDIWSPWVDGSVIKVRIITNDYGNIGYGFYIDGYETDLIAQGGCAGASVKLTPGDYEVSTNENGAFVVNSVPAGTYTMTPSKLYWKFQPAYKIVDIPSGGSVNGIEFTAFPPGSIMGEVKTATSVVNAVTVESEHPYDVDYEETWTVTGDPNATRIRLHFSKIHVEPAWDFVYVMDADDNIVEIYTALESDLWTPWIDGNTAKIMISTDDMNNYYGFKCDAYQVDVLGQGLGGVNVIMGPEGLCTTTDSNGAFSFPMVAVGEHTVTPDMSFWMFDPDLLKVSVPAGMERRVMFFAGLAQGTGVPGSKYSPDGIRVALDDLIVTAVFDGFFYAQSKTGMNGVRVEWDEEVSEGSVVDITGTLDTVGGERRIIAEEVK